MRVFFILFGIFCISLFLSITRLREYNSETNPKEQQGTLSFFQNEIDRLGVTSSTINVLQEKALTQLNQITRLEACVAILKAKSNSK